MYKYFIITFLTIIILIIGALFEFRYYYMSVENSGQLVGGIVRVDRLTGKVEIYITSTKSWMTYGY